jgi:hypothetical protein
MPAAKNNPGGIVTTQQTRRGNGLVDVTAQTFGHLTVLEQAASIGGAAAWLCRCTCGEEVIVTGTALRRGNRRSCGCKDPNKGSRKTKQIAPSPAPPPPETGRCWLEELDGFVALVGRTRGDDVLVEFNPASKAWECSACGRQPILACAHVGAVTARLPLATALAIGRIIAPNRPGSLSTKVGGAAEGNSVNEKALAAALAKGASKRAERLSLHDQEHQRLTGPVTVRQMTDEDRERLRLARERKRRLVGDPEAV